MEFDDSGWVTGRLGVGYETGAGYDDFIGIDVSDSMLGINGAVYLRAPFTISDLDEIDHFRLGMRYDDGFVAFLNGNELIRQNAPQQVAWNSTATQSHSDLRATILSYFDLPLDQHRPALKIGDNMLSIIGLNSSIGGSDMLISPVLQKGTYLGT